MGQLLISHVITQETNISVISHVLDSRGSIIGKRKSSICFIENTIRAEGRTVLFLRHRKFVGSSASWLVNFLPGGEASGFKIHCSPESINLLFIMPPFVFFNIPAFTFFRRIPVSFLRWSYLFLLNVLQTKWVFFCAVLLYVTINTFLTV